MARGTGESVRDFWIPARAVNDIVGKIAAFLDEHQLRISQARLF